MELVPISKGSERNGTERRFFIRKLVPQIPMKMAKIHPFLAQFGGDILKTLKECLWRFLKTHLEKWTWHTEWIVI